jgi:hypothetical protein
MRSDAMFARVSTILGKPERVEDGIHNYIEQTLPGARKMTGFKDALLMVDRQTGKMALFGTPKRTCKRVR